MVTSIVNLKKTCNERKCQENLKSSVFKVHTFGKNKFDVILPVFNVSHEHKQIAEGKAYYAFGNEEQCEVRGNCRAVAFITVEKKSKLNVSLLVYTSSKTVIGEFVLFTHFVSLTFNCLVIENDRRTHEVYKIVMLSHNVTNIHSTNVTIYEKNSIRYEWTFDNPLQFEMNELNSSGLTILSH